MPPPLFYRLLPLYALFIVTFFFALAFWQDPTDVPTPLVTSRAAMPPLDLPLLTTSEQRLTHADITDNVTLVNMFASWCIPCIFEHSHLLALSQHYPMVKRIGIAYKDPPQQAERFLRRHGNPYHIVGYDQDGSNALLWGASGVPETFIIDKHQTVRYHLRAPITDSILAQDIIPLLTRLLAEP